MVRLRSVLLIPAGLLAALMIVACGDDGANGNGDDASGAATPTEGPADETPAPPADDEDVPEPASGDESAGGAGSVMDGVVTGDMGTVTVEGESYPMTDTLRCEPGDVAGFEYDLEMITRNLAGDHQGQFHVYLGGVLDVDVSWIGPEGVFGGAEGGEADWSNGRVSGSAVVSDAMGDSDTIDISFDLVVPDGETDCQ